MILDNLEQLIEQVESGFGKIVGYVKTLSERAPETITVMPEINFPEQKAPKVEVNVPQQAAPVVNVKPEITVNVPEICIPQPHVVIQGTPAKRWEFKVNYDRDGDIESISAERME